MDRTDTIKKFKLVPDYHHFNQNDLTHILGVTLDRVIQGFKNGNGVRICFVDENNYLIFKKADILAWISKHPDFITGRYYATHSNQPEIVHVNKFKRSFA